MICTTLMILMCTTLIIMMCKTLMIRMCLTLTIKMCTSFTMSQWMVDNPTTRMDHMLTPQLFRIRGPINTPGCKLFTEHACGLYWATWKKKCLHVHC